jgi:hypothetical protein
MGKQGKGLRKQSWNALVTFLIFFYFLFLYLSLKLKTQPIQLRDRPFNMQGEGAWFFAKKNNLMLNFEKKYFGRDGYRKTI